MDPGLSSDQLFLGLPCAVDPGLSSDQLSSVPPDPVAFDYTFDSVLSSSSLL